MPHFRTWDGTYYDFHSAASPLQGTRSVPAAQLVLNYEEIKVTY